MGFVEQQRLRRQRMTALLRARRRGRQLTLRTDRTAAIAAGDVLLICVIHNERLRLPYFLKYYRMIGVRHFLIVDNNSTDGSDAYLSEQPDVSLWHTASSYRAASFGLDWSNHLARQYGVGHWIVTVDADELLVYPYCDLRSIDAMTDWLDTLGVRSFGTLLLDMYPKAPISAASYKEGQNPLDVARWFDAGNYVMTRNPSLRNLWIQGGVRMRCFFDKNPIEAPALNKIPLVKWERSFAYVSSTHMLLPRGLNLVYDAGGGERISGVLMHFKLMNTLEEKAKSEEDRGEHYEGGREYRAYREALTTMPSLWSPHSEYYVNWRQLEVLGLMSTGSWI